MLKKKMQHVMWSSEIQFPTECSGKTSLQWWHLRCHLNEKMEQSSGVPARSGNDLDKESLVRMERGKWVRIRCVSEYHWDKWYSMRSLGLIEGLDWKMRTQGRFAVFGLIERDSIFKREATSRGDELGVRGLMSLVGNVWAALLSGKWSQQLHT